MLMCVCECVCVCVCVCETERELSGDGGGGGGFWKGKNTRLNSFSKHTKCNSTLPGIGHRKIN